MPSLPPKLCSKAGCYSYSRAHDKALCHPHYLELRRKVDKGRGPGSKRGAGAFRRGVREAVAKGSHYLCVLCNRPGNELDHRVPTADGGSNHSSNAQWLCRECHAAKTRAENARRNKGGREGPTPNVGV